VTQDSNDKKDTVIVESIKPAKFGRGSFLITPEVGRIYMMKVRVNKASKETYHLIPKVDETLALNFKALKGSVNCQEPIELDVYTDKPSN